MSIGKTKSFYIVQIILIIAGFSELLLADCYYVPYLFVLMLGILSLYRNLQPASEEIVIYSKSLFPWIAVVFSFLFACMITLANYELWIDRTFHSILILVAVFSEFRYNYAVFCTLPIVIVLVLRPNILLDFRREEKI